jgi:hypothetical protein
MPSVYIETSIISYLRNRPSKNVVAAARQVLTRQWWDAERRKYQLVTSQHVFDEAMRGDLELAAERKTYLEGIPLLFLDPQIQSIASEIQKEARLPAKAQLDALHIAVTAFHRVNYLLTWNCTHIANARILPRIHRAIIKTGFSVPIICTPEEMLDDDITN